MSNGIIFKNIEFKFDKNSRPIGNGGIIGSNDFQLLVRNQILSNTSKIIEDKCNIILKKSSFIDQGDNEYFLTKEYILFCGVVAELAYATDFNLSS